MPDKFCCQQGLQITHMYTQEKVAIFGDFGWFFGFLADLGGTFGIFFFASAGKPCLLLTI